MNRVARAARALVDDTKEESSTCPEPQNDSIVDHSYEADSDRLASTSCYHALSLALKITNGSRRLRHMQIPELHLSIVIDYRLIMQL
jgi:hypothetical protein